MGEDRAPRVGVSWVQVAGSALAAVSSAVLLSTLGVAGTVIGAAVGSVVATVGSSLYTRTLDVSRQQVAAQTAALRRVARARSELEELVVARDRGEGISATGISRAGRELDEAEEVLAASGATAEDTDPEQPAVRDGGRSGVPLEAERPSRTERPTERLTERMAGRVAGRGLSWKRLAAVAAGVFLAAMVAITVFELVTGEAVSQLTGGSDTPTGSTVPGLGRARDRATPGPTDGPTPEQSPTGEPTSSTTPSEAPTPSSTPSTDPTAALSPTVVPTPTPTVVPAPSPSPGVSGTPTELPSSTATGVTGG